MNFIISLLIAFVAINVIAAIPLIGVGVLGWDYIFGVIVPYAALVLFFGGLVWRVISWSRSPVPFRIPTTAGQQKSLEWIKPGWIDNPSDTKGVWVRMFFEVLFFRSLFRNTRMEFREGPKIGYEWEKWLWLFALGFHYSFLVVVLRHLRFFTDPIPKVIYWLEWADSFLEAGIAPLQGVGVPEMLLSGFVLMGAVTLLLLRRLLSAQVRYISLSTDYFPLFLILGIGTTGILMRYTGMLLYRLIGIDFLSVDIVKVKELAMGLFSFSPTVPEGIGTIFFIHLFLVCTLIAYFPFSKLLHMAGVFLSPTRNLSNNNRIVRHINPWNYPVKVHSYQAYEDEFREKMVEAGLPVEKMPEETAEEAESNE
jgi:nitrate reductase gamma subunit